MRSAGTRFTGDFQLRYRAYAHDHGMTAEQMLMHDRECCPDALLMPCFLWLSRKWFQWGQQNPQPNFHHPAAEAQFEHWLDQLAPESDAVTCECHQKLVASRRRRRTMFRTTLAPWCEARPGIRRNRRQNRLQPYQDSEPASA